MSIKWFLFHHQMIFFFVKEQNIILQSLKKSSPSFYTFYTVFLLFLLLFFSVGKGRRRVSLSAQHWVGRGRATLAEFNSCRALR